MNVHASPYLTRQAAEQAVGMALPMMEQAVKDPVIGARGFLYIVVMDPSMGPAMAEFEEAILYEHAIGDTSQWDVDYAGQARAKAHRCWRAGTDTQAAQETRPYLLIAKDTARRGSTVLDGIIVGVSGANPWYDEAFAGCVAICLRAIALGPARAMPAQPSNVQVV